MEGQILQAMRQWAKPSQEGRRAFSYADVGKPIPIQSAPEPWGDEKSLCFWRSDCVKPNAIVSGRID